MLLSFLTLFNISLLLILFYPLSMWYYSPYRNGFYWAEQACFCLGGFEPTIWENKTVGDVNVTVVSDGKLSWQKSSMQEIERKEKESV